MLQRVAVCFSVFQCVAFMCVQDMIIHKYKHIRDSCIFERRLVYIRDMSHSCVHDESEQKEIIYKYTTAYIII